jgi:hypothetical protein
MYATTRVKLPLRQVRLAPGAGHAQDGHRSHGIELSHNEGRLKVLRRVMHLRDGAGAEHLAERVDRPVDDTRCGRPDA